MQIRSYNKTYNVLPILKIHVIRLSVNGGWSLWSSWSTCSTSCNGGEKRRHRSCSNPAPVGTGRQCSGNSDDTTECNTQRCTGKFLMHISYLAHLSRRLTR